MTNKIKYIIILLVFSLFSGCVVDEIGDQGYQSGWRALWLNQQACTQVNSYFILMQKLDRYLNTSEELRPELEDLLFDTYKLRKGEGTCWNINEGTQTVFTIDTGGKDFKAESSEWSLFHNLGYGFTTKAICACQPEDVYRIGFNNMYVEDYKADGTFIFVPESEQGANSWRLTGQTNLQKQGGVIQIKGQIAEPLLVESKQGLFLDGQLDMEIINQETLRSEEAIAFITTRYGEYPARCITIQFKNSTDSYEYYLFE
ncbi:MAG: hypothetical protein RR837_05610 [Bacteroidales bacterium]